MIKWLSRIYQKVTTNRMTKASLDDFVRQYNEVLRWSGMDDLFEGPGQEAARVWLERLSDRIHFHRLLQGCTFRDDHFMPPVRTGDKKQKEPQRKFNCHIALDGVRSLFNVGSIFRICDASGFKSVILGNTMGKSHPKVEKTAMGAQQWVEEEITSDLSGGLMKKKQAGFRIIGIETVESATPYHVYPWQDNTIVVFGNEEYGISSHVMATCDDFVHIPMSGCKNSINIATAASVICFQILVTLTSREQIPCQTVALP